MKCPYCGQQLLDDSTKVCSNCGRDVNVIHERQQSATPQAKSAIVERPVAPQDFNAKMKLELNSLKSEISAIQLAQEALGARLQKVLQRLDDLGNSL